MSVVKQKGILSAATDPAIDADVIMTAAVVGWAWTRLKAGKNCKVDLEVVDDKKLTEEQLTNQTKDIQLHDSVVKRVNTLLEAAQIGAVAHKMEVGVTPIWTVGGRITGGTGDQAITSEKRYNPPLPDGYAAKLYLMATNETTAHLMGYQGRGAYTGFVDGRTDGQTGLMSTFRHVVPTTDDYGRRWHPDPAHLPPGAPLGTGDTQRVWGMIVDNKMQRELKDKWGMHLDDSNPTDFTTHPTPKVTLTPGTHIVGYTHGMIQAIYDVHWHKKTNPGGNPGTPYEIAVGKQTTKLASCFPCSIFMEATGHPASSTHLGRGESWSPLYPPKTPTTTQHTAWKECNDLWHNTCKSIIDAGLKCLLSGNKGHVVDGHHASVDALHTYVTTHTDPLAYSNLILDAITVHDGEVKRVDRTLKK